MKYISRDDISKIIDLDKLIFKSCDCWPNEKYYKYLDDSNKSGLCVYHNDKLIGYILYKNLYNFINIDSLGVIYEYRNKGIGTLLIKFLINLAKKNKMNIRLQVRISNIIAINLYSKLGFKKKSILKNYYSNEDGWLMECLCF